MKKILALVLAALMLLGCLSACSGSQQTDAAAEKGPSISAKYAYKSEMIPLKLPEGAESLYRFTQVGDRLLAVYSRSEGGETYYDSSTVVHLCEVSLTDGTVKDLDWYQPLAPEEGYNGDGSITFLREDAQGNLWIADSVTSYRYELPANFDMETQDAYEYYEDLGTQKRLCRYSADGQLINTVELPTEVAETELATIDELGQLYFSDWENAYVLDSEGKLLKTISLSSAGLTDFCGKPAIESYGESYILRYIDPKTLSEGPEVKRPATAWNGIVSNMDAYDFFYVSSGNLYGYAQATDTSDLVVDWMDLDLNPMEMDTPIALSDGRFLGIYNDYNSGSGEPSLVILTQTDPATVPQKTTLKLACMYISYDLRSRILEFNKTSDSVRIIISDYSQYATEDDFYAGLTKLNTEIMAGQVPDLFVVDNLPISQYIAAGVIEPLNDWFASDSELSLEDLVPSVLNAVSVDGKLYEAYSSFTVDTVVTLKRVAENYPVWNLDAVQDAMNYLQDDATIFSVDYTRDNVLEMCVGRSINRFVDWQTGKCSFDSRDFKDLLSFCMQFPATFNWEDFDWSNYVSAYDAVHNGRQLMMPTTVYSMNDYMWLLAGINDEISFVGYPSQDGSGSGFNINSAICMSSTCADKAAAWSFLREFFTEEYQNEEIVESQSGLPSNQTSFDKMIEKAMTPDYQKDDDGKLYLDENGEKVLIPKVSVYVDENTQNEMDVLSQAHADLLCELVKTVNTTSGSNDAIFDIVQEEVGAYFEGQRSVDDVSAMIQNRVGLYVAEQK